MSSWRQRYHRYSTRVYRPDRRAARLSWVGDERIAIGNLPTGAGLLVLPDEGVTHVVNCRTRAQTWISQDLAVERALFGPSRVVHVPMWDLGLSPHPRLWSAAALFAAEVLETDPDARVLVHCHQGRRRSIMLTYAVLRLRGHAPDDATRLIAAHRVEARFVDAYTSSVEAWLAAGAAPVGPLRAGVEAPFRAARAPR
ncbi:MAG TPA: hypothetical protein VI011_25075 [Asanoa sp.]